MGDKKDDKEDDKEDDKKDDKKDDKEDDKEDDKDDKNDAPAPKPVDRKRNTALKPGQSPMDYRKEHYVKVGKKQSLKLWRPLNKAPYYNKIYPYGTIRAPRPKHPKIKFAPKPLVIPPPPKTKSQLTKIAENIKAETKSLINSAKAKGK